MYRSMGVNRQEEEEALLLVRNVIVNSVRGHRGVNAIIDVAAREHSIEQGPYCNLPNVAERVPKRKVKIAVVIEMHVTTMEARELVIASVRQDLRERAVSQVSGLTVGYRQYIWESKIHVIDTLEYQKTFVLFLSREVNFIISSIFSSLRASGHQINFDDFKIPSFCSNSYELIIHEGLLITKYRLTLI